MLLQRAVTLAPNTASSRLDLAILLFGQRRNAEALPHFRFLVEHAPDKAIFRASLAVCYASIGAFAQAIVLYEQCRAEFGHDLDFLLNYADSLKYAGRRDDCVALLRSALKLRPGSGPAWWALANVKTEIFSSGDIETMLAHLAGTAMSERDRYHTHYALGLAFEQRAEYETSFSHYASGAIGKRTEIRYDDTNALAMAEREKAFFSADRLAQSASRGFPDSAPIFIVGMPRAGSTLVEQILASHSKVEGTMELPEIAAIVRDLESRSTHIRYPETLAEHDAEALAALGHRYIENTRIYRHTGKVFFTDKMPSNCAHVGLIHMMLPNAKIVDVRRNKLANCFSMFKQLFGHGVGYSYDFDELARYYALYEDRMAHLDAVLPGRVHRIQYEDLVNDTEAETRRLLAYCGLDFEPSCIRFWESRRGVATPSAEQVRRPIFRSGLHAWQNYEPWLGPLKQKLSHALK